MFEFIDIKTVLTIFHLLGVVVGMGAAFMTDFIFMKSTKDKVLDEKELSFISLGSRVVWIGLILIILSGIGMFLLSPEEYLDSSKFLTKMFVVLVLSLNGLAFHFKHLPLLRSLAGQNLTQSEIFRKKSFGLFISGGVSTTSWLTALTLGSFRSIPFEFKIIVSVYLSVLVVAILSSLFARKLFLENKI